MSTTRKCATCGEWKSLTEFALKPGASYKLRGICTTCEPPISAHVRDAMCGSKVRYQSEGNALAVAQNAARRTELMRVYKCPLCRGWHLTHKRAREAS